MPAASQQDVRPPLPDCQELIGYQFADVTLLQEALTHASSADHRLASNERLEFLGDAILGAIVCELLYRKFPDYLEGDLTKIKSAVVSKYTCAKISATLALGRFLVMRVGLDSSGEAPASVMADVFESLIGAIYLDGGIGAAREFILRHIEPEIDAAVKGDDARNPDRIWTGSPHKSKLQQVAQRDYGATPTYVLLDENGPDHSKCFKVEARIGERSYPPAWARTKKEAEQRAALNALCQLAGDPLPHVSD
jgi:ribonuclease-3